MSSPPKNFAQGEVFPLRPLPTNRSMIRFNNKMFSLSLVMMPLPGSLVRPKRRVRRTSGGERNPQNSGETERKAQERERQGKKRIEGGSRLKDQVPNFSVIRITQGEQVGRSIFPEPFKSPSRPSPLAALCLRHRDLWCPCALRCSFGPGAGALDGSGNSLRTPPPPPKAQGTPDPA